MAKTYKILMRQILFDVGEFEAETEEDALEMAANELDPNDVEDNLYWVTEIIDENGNIEIPPKKSIDDLLYGKE